MNIIKDKQKHIIKDKQKHHVAHQNIKVMITKQQTIRFERIFSRELQGSVKPIFYRLYFTSGRYYINRL